MSATVPKANGSGGGGSGSGGGSASASASGSAAASVSSSVSASGSASASASSSSFVGGSYTDSQANRRIPSHGGSKVIGGVVPQLDISALLAGAVLDKDDAVIALNKLVQRALRAAPFVKLEHLREVLDRWEAAIVSLEAQCPESDLEARLTPGSRVSRLKHETLSKLALRDDGVDPTATGVTRVVIPDHRVTGGIGHGGALGPADAWLIPPNSGGNGVNGFGPGSGLSSVPLPNGGAGSPGNPNSAAHAAARAAAASRASANLAAAALIGSSKPPSSSLASAAAERSNGPSVAANCNHSNGVMNSGVIVPGGADGPISPRDEVPVYVATPLQTKPVAGHITKDYDSPSMARRTLTGAKLGGGTGPQASSRSKVTIKKPQQSDSDDEDEKAHPVTPADPQPGLGLGLHGSASGPLKPRNKLLDKIAGRTASSRASPSPANPSSGLDQNARVAAAPAMSLDASPSMNGRRIGAKGGNGNGNGANANGNNNAHARSASATQSSLVSAAVGSLGLHSAKSSISEEEKVIEPPSMASTPMSAGGPRAHPSAAATAAALLAAATAPSAANTANNTPVSTPAVGFRTADGEPATEATRTQLQSLLNRALRLVPAYRYSPISFRQLQTQFETAVSFMEERCSDILAD